MEPGHEDREYHPGAGVRVCHGTASMEPGHEDREYGLQWADSWPGPSRLNGARS